MINIVISTFSGYHKVLLETLSAYRNLDIGAKFYIVSDRRLEHDFTDMQIDQTITGQDLGWNKAIQILLNQFQSDEYVILTMDDLLPYSVANPSLIVYFIQLAQKEKMDALKLYEPPSQRFSSSLEADFMPFRSSKEDKYAISTMFSIYRVSFLSWIVEQSDNAWKYERGARNMMRPSHKVYTLGLNLISFKNIVIKGMVVNKRLKSFKESSDSNLKNMNAFQLFKHYMTIFISAIRSFSLSRYLRFLLK